MVGISTRAMMLRLMIPPGSFILHLGAMYKMNQYDYPVLVVGGSDRSRRFHLVALFVISQETQPVVQAALLVLRRQFYWITHKHLLLRYAMDDCDQAECNALAAVFGDNPSYRFLMCFFHVVKKVQVAIKPFSSGAAATVLREVYDLHFVRSLVSYLEMLRAVLKLWLGEPGLVVFAQYMYGQWLSGRFATWQVFVLPKPSRNFQRFINAGLYATSTAKDGLAFEGVKCLLPRSVEWRASYRIWSVPDTNPRPQGVELLRRKEVGGGGGG
ncbi:hypothetical protein PC116_g23137 [Phytophthora cactorum]|nr:hypothetical protein PC116_g23137 [Phytophthora cactorum]